MISKTILIGRVEDEPLVTRLASGDRVVNMILVTTESWKDSKTGLRRERYERHKIAVFVERLADIIEAHVRKNTMMYLEGQIESRIWTDNQGITRNAVDIVLRPGRSTITILDGEDAHGSQKTIPNSAAV